MAIMEEAGFGPILPLRTYRSVADVVEQVNPALGLTW